MENSCKFFRNTACRYFPCHDGVDPERFNCLFCYCPLYGLGDRCGGNRRYVGDENVKCCTECTFPHEPENYDLVVEKLGEVVRQERKTPGATRERQTEQT